MSEEVVVIGAGPAGLTAAYELSKFGMHTTLLEADSQVGGLSRTVNYGGYRFDIGGHRFFSKIPIVNELWREILQDEFLLRSRLSRIHYRGRYFDYPLKPINALVGLGLMESLRIGLSYAKAKVAPNPVEENFEQWVTNRFGSRLYHIFFKTYTEKVWGIPCTEISADWAAQRIKNLSLREAVRNALFGSGRSKDGEVITTLIDQFYYPRFGPGMMWEHCAELLAAQGHDTLYGVRVERVRHRHGRVTCVSGRMHTGEEVELGGDQVLSTMPLRDLIFAMDPVPPDEVLQAARNLRYRDYQTVVLIVKRASVFPDNWIYIHSPEVKMGRIQNYKNWSPDMVPNPEFTSLGLEYFLWDHDPEWSWPQEQLIQLGIEDCASIGLIDPSEVSDGTVVRMPKAYPVYDQHYHRSIATVQAYLKQIENLQTIGRNGLHRYNNQDHSMLTGVYAARNIMGEAYDVWSVNTEQEYHEEGRASEVASGDRLVPVRVDIAQGEPALTPDELIDVVFAKLDPLALGMGVGIVAGMSLFLVTLMSLLQYDPSARSLLALLGQYFVGFELSWTGAVVGFVQAGVWGFALGCLGAGLRNWGMGAYAALLQRQETAKAQRDLLDKV